MKPSSLEFSEWLDAHALDALYLGEWGVQFDEQSNRIIVPVLSSQGRLSLQVIRNLDSRRVTYELLPPKCRASHTLFGLHQTIPQITKEGYVVICEGFSDALSLNKIGIPAVSSLTSNVSRVQMALLNPWTDTVIVFADGDDAGMDMATRANESFDKITTARIVGYDPSSAVAEDLPVGDFIHSVLDWFDSMTYVEYVDGFVSLVER